MPRNLELKAVTSSLVRAATMARSLPARRAGVLYQTDTYFTVATGRLKLRVNRGSVAELIAYKRRDHRGARISTYSRIPVVNAPEMRKALGGTLGVRSTVRKRRVVFLYQNARIHLDSVRGHGSFIEFEVMVRQGMPQARRLMKHLKSVFQIRRKDIWPGSYGDRKER